MLGVIWMSGTDGESGDDTHSILIAVQLASGPSENSCSRQEYAKVEPGKVQCTPYLASNDSPVRYPRIATFLAAAWRAVAPPSDDVSHPSPLYARLSIFSALSLPSHPNSPSLNVLASSRFTFSTCEVWLQRWEASQRRFWPSCVG